MILEVFIEIGDHETRRLAHSDVEPRTGHRVRLGRPTCYHQGGELQALQGQTQRILEQIRETLATSFYFLREVFLGDFLIFFRN